MTDRPARLACLLAGIALLSPNAARADRYDDAGRAIRAVLEREGFPIEVATTSDANTFVDPVALTADWQRVHAAVVTAFGTHIDVVGRPSGVFIDNNRGPTIEGAAIRENVAFYSEDPRLQVAVIRGLFGEPRPRIGFGGFYLALRQELPKISKGFLDAETAQLDLDRIETCLGAALDRLRIGGKTLPRRGDVSRIATRWFGSLPDESRDAWSQAKTQFRLVIQTAEVAGEVRAGDVAADSGTAHRISVEAFCEVRRAGRERTLLRIGPVAMASFSRGSGEYVFESRVAESRPGHTIRADAVPDPAPPTSDDGFGVPRSPQRTLNYARSKPIADYAQRVLEALKPTLVDGCPDR